MIGIWSRTIHSSLHYSGPTPSTMDMELYDEFGNYIGPELESESEDSSEEEREEEEEPKDDGMDQDEEEEGGQSMAIVLHEV